MSHDDSTNDPMNFVKNMWGNMGFSLPGMVTPTFDVEEIEKRVKDMKAVEGWLKMNLSMLQMTIQSLEMQCVTLNAVRTMSNMAGSHASSTSSATSAPETETTAEETGGEGVTQASMWPWNLMQQMQDQMQKAAAEQTAAASQETAAGTAKRGKKSQ